MRKRTDLLNALFADIKKSADRRAAPDGRADKAAALRGFLRPHQVVLERDHSPLVGVRSARQVGKSTAALLIASIRCVERPDSAWVIIGLTRASVKKAYWGILQGFSDAFELGIKFQGQELTATFPNGSRIYFVGAENFDEIEKLRGGRYHGAIIDECKSFSELTFTALIEDVLGPALMGQAGQIYAIGTPGDVLRGDFYLATCEPPVLLKMPAQDLWSNRRFERETSDGKPAVWSLHVWTLRDNDVRFRDPRTGLEFTLWDKAQEIKLLRGWADDHPSWRREYLGEWVGTEGRIVYRYRPHLHDYTPVPDALWGLPGPKDTVWRTSVGIDFGTKDGTAFVIWAWSPTEPGLWEVYSERRYSTAGRLTKDNKDNGDLRLPISAIAKWYRDIEATYGPFDGVVADPAGLATMVAESLAVDYGIYIEAAEKREKNDHIELLNNDLDARLIHLIKGSELGAEMLGNRWLEKTVGTEKRKEDPETPNDLCDAALYAFRWCRHRQAKPADAPVAMFSAAWWETQASDELKLAERRARARSSEAAELDRDWWLERDSN